MFIQSRAKSFLKSQPFSTQFPRTTSQKFMCNKPSGRARLPPTPPHVSNVAIPVRITCCECNVNVKADCD